MSIFDRYTILKWKEACKDSAGNFLLYISGLYDVCNASMKSRVISAGALAAIILLIAGLYSLFKPEPPEPVAKILVLKATDTQGDRWAMDYLKNQDIQAILSGKVKPGQPLTLTFKFQRQSANLLILPEITGTAGEKYFPGIIKNGQWQPAPRLVISDQSGKMLHKGQFEYG